MAVNEQSSPQTGNQDTVLTAPDSSAACEAAATSQQRPASTAVDAMNEETVVNGPPAGRPRRKQCRPVRVCLHDDDDNTYDAQANAKSPEVNSLPEVVILPTQNVCELCGAESMSPEALTAHAEFCRGRADPVSDDVTASGRAFPTRYHELGEALMRSAETVLVDSDSCEAYASYSSDHNILARCVGRAQQLADDNDESRDVPLDFTLHSSQLASATFSSSSASGVSDGSAMSSVSAMVKQPPEMTSSTAASLGSDAEDFCEFCQKHFCNKYYLRKHRHDVHGVTSSDTQPLIPQQQQQRQAASSFLPQEALTLLSLTSESLSVQSSAAGTSTTSTSALSHQLPFQSPALMTSFVAPSTNSLLFQSAPSAPDLAASSSTAALLPSLTSLMLLNPFASSLALLNSPAFLHQTSPGAALSASSSLNTLAELQKSNVPAGGFGGLCDDVATLGALMNPFLPASDSASMAVDDPLSSSHYCELCGKEFCSAYFASVHRREKHGITTSTALSDAMRLLAAGTVRPSAGLESVSGAVEPGEKLGTTSGSSLLAKDRSTHNDGARSEPASSEHTCCLCKKQFPNRYGLVLHLLSAHNIRPEGFGLAGELLQLDGVGGKPHLAAATSTAKSAAGSGSGPSTASATSSKQSDRVSCDICNKEVCNKYFLKTHKMKVHGLDSAAAAVYNPPAPVLDSGRHEAARSPASVASSRQHQHDEMRKALLMADSQFSTFASHLDLALKSVASADLTGSAGFGFLPPSLHQQQQQSGEPVMRAADIFRLFGLVGSKQDDPFVSMGPPPPPPLSLQSLLPSTDLPDPMADIAKHTKVELKIPKHVAGMMYQHKDAASGGAQQTGRVKHSSAHHHGRLGRDQAHLTSTSVRQTSQLPAAVPPSDQELIQSGIDPEAFCELCQKEFCSKYFLRTHRQKIHGVSPSKTDASFDHYRPMSQQATPANPVLQIFPGLPLPTQPIFGPCPAAMLPPSVGAGSVVESVASDAVTTGAGAGAVGLPGRCSGKDAANATRVMCDVCGKELCNKYFLKTHMAKIHGITGGSAVTGIGHVELDISEVALPENRQPTDYSVPRSSALDEKCSTTNGSLSNSCDNGNISPLPADSTSSRRPESGNCIQQTGGLHTDASSRDTVSNTDISPDQSRFSRDIFAGNETMTHMVDYDEQGRPENEHKLIITKTSSYVDIEHKLEAAAEDDTDGVQLRGKKRELTGDADVDGKRPRTDYCPEYSSSSVGHHETDEHKPWHDTTATSRVIQFVSRSKESLDQDSVTVKEDVPTNSCRSLDTSTDCRPSTSSRQRGCNVVSEQADRHATVNGHADTRDQTSWYSIGAKEQRTSPVMQPFVMHQEAHPAAGEQFAPCQLVLPVIKPVRDAVTVEFSVTPVSSE